MIEWIVFIVTILVPIGAVFTIRNIAKRKGATKWAPLPPDQHELQSNWLQIFDLFI